MFFWARGKELQHRKDVQDYESTSIASSLEENYATAIKEVTRGTLDQIMTAFSRPATRANLHENINLGMDVIREFHKLYDEGGRFVLPSNALPEDKEDLPIDAGGSLPSFPSEPVRRKALAAVAAQEATAASPDDSDGDGGPEET